MSAIHLQFKLSKPIALILFLIFSELSVDCSEWSPWSTCSIVPTLAQRKITCGGNATQWRVRERCIGVNPCLRSMYEIQRCQKKCEEDSKHNNNTWTVSGSCMFNQFDCGNGFQATNPKKGKAEEQIEHRLCEESSPHFSSCFVPCNDSCIGKKMHTTSIVLNPSLKMSNTICFKKKSYIQDITFLQTKKIENDLEITINHSYDNKTWFHYEGSFDITNNATISLSPLIYCYCIKYYMSLALSSDLEVTLHYCDGTNFSNWGKWTECNENCAIDNINGIRNRTRKCVYDGIITDNKYCYGSSIQYESCTRICYEGLIISRVSDNTSKIYEVCYKEKEHTTYFEDSKTFLGTIEISEWSTWCNCSSLCGFGIRNRTRRCYLNNTETHNKDLCPQDLVEYSNCIVDQPCFKITEWNEWSTCDVTCGVGRLRRARTCVSYLDNLTLWENCNSTENPTEEKICEQPTNCTYISGWSAWSHCSVTCGFGVMARNRTCAWENGSISDWNNCNPRNDQNETDTENCNTPRSCESWSNWNYSSCSVSCGGGKIRGSRVCLSLEGVCTGSNETFNDCNELPCPDDIKLGDWSIWSECSASCGEGRKKRFGTCNESLYCKDVIDTATCNEMPCAIDGAWAQWNKWSECSKLCNGIKLRNRYCNDPSPLKGGNDCFGTSQEEESCNIRVCPINGSWSLWSSWSACNQPCNGGNTTRHRKCNNPEPQFDGYPCQGVATEKLKCNLQNCRRHIAVNLRVHFINEIYYSLFAQKDGVVIKAFQKKLTDNIRALFNIDDTPVNHVIVHNVESDNNA